MNVIDWNRAVQNCNYNVEKAIEENKKENRELPTIAEVVEEWNERPPEER